MKDVVELPTTGCGHACAAGASNEGVSNIDRRDFVTRAAAALAAVALAACGMGGEGATSPTSVSSTTLTLANYPSLANVGGVATTSVDGVPLAIVRTGDTSFAAFSRICPHQGGTIQTTSTGFQCPVHGATFNRSGQWVGGQRTSNMRQYPVTYDAAVGTLTID
jgi:nitrite reductase/ring-hydroxylating ferredoxin subunit